MNQSFKLTDIFEIKFVNEILENEVILEHIKDKLNSIPIDKMLFLHKDIFEQFMIVISTNFSYFKPDSSISINSNIDNIITHNIVSQLQDFISNITNNQEGSTLHDLYLSNIDNLNEQNLSELIIENDIGDEYEYEYIDELEDAFVNEENENEGNENEGNENEGNENGDNSNFKKVQYIQLHFFQKEFSTYYEMWTDNVKYITTFFLSDQYNLSDYFNIENNKLGKFPIFESIKTLEDIKNLKLPEVYNKLCSLNYYYKSKNFKNLNDIDFLNNHINNYTELDSSILNNLNKIYSGLYFHFNDIKLQMMLRLYMTSMFGQNGNLIDYKKHYDYTLDTTLNNYFSFDINNYNNFEIIMIKNMFIVCDKCSKKVSDNIFDQKYYHNHKSGDLCNECYKLKQNMDYQRIINIKKIILLQGKRLIFKNELKKTKMLLKSTKIKKMKKMKYYQLIENINTILISNQKNRKQICNICYSNLEDDIYVGSECGHCFHKTCIELSNAYQCQLCRIHTKFIKLYL